MREEIAQLVEDNAESHIEPDIYKIAIADVLSILDKWECVADHVIESFTVDRTIGYCLDPGDHVIILRKNE